MSYGHLTLEERYQIAAMRDVKCSVTGIAHQLNRSPSTISRELQRNLIGKTYRAASAQHAALIRRSQGSSHPKIDAAMIQRIGANLHSRLSPEQIFGRSRLEGAPMVSRSSLYRYIHRHNLRHRLRLPKRRRPYGAGRAKRFTDRKPIQQRPPQVQTRERLGDWELDTVRPSQGSGVIVTMVERATGFARLGWCERGTAESVCAVIGARLWFFRRNVLTMTFDRGSEFAYDGVIEKALSAQAYFADPHAPWQRGCNENYNGLLRQYFPRSRDFSTITPKELQQAEDMLNARPRKRLSFLTPAEVFFNYDSLALRG